MSPRKLRYAAFAVALAVVVTNILLIRQNLALREELQAVQASPALKPGDRIAPFSAPSLGGELLQVDFNGSVRHRVFLHLSSACPYTDVQFPYWCRMIESADLKRFEIVGMVDEGEDPFQVSAYLQSQACDVSFPVIRFDRGLAQELQLSISPSTLIVDPKGMVEKSWSGMWHRDEVQEAIQMVTAQSRQASATGPTEQ